MKRPLVWIAILAALAALLLVVDVLFRGRSSEDRSRQAPAEEKVTPDRSPPSSTHVAKPSGSGPPNFDETQALRHRIDELTSEREAERRNKERKCGTIVSSECPFLNPSKDTLLEMARCGVVKFDLPLPDESNASDAGQRSQVDELKRQFWDRRRNELLSILRQLGQDPGSVQNVEALEEAVEKVISPATTEEVQRRIAREKAGLLPVLGPSEVTSAPPAERYWRSVTSLGDDYEAYLAGTLGAARAHELRTEGDGWPVKKLYSGKCEGDAGP